MEVDGPRRHQCARLRSFADLRQGGRPETADRHEGELAEAKSVRLKEKIAALRERQCQRKIHEGLTGAG